jgi:transposase
VEAQHLCADAGYVGQPADQAIAERGLVPHVRSRKQEIEEIAQHKPQAKPRRWVVERAHSWINRFRELMSIRENRRVL